jgi:hypothetical protein
MNIRGKKGLSCLLLAIAVPLSAHAEIYRWVDADGVVHFSDRPPVSDSAEVSTVAVQAAQPASREPGSDPFNLDATAARTQAQRDKLADQREQRATQSPATPAPVVQTQGQVADYDEPYGYPAYPRPPRPDRPVRPIRPQPEPQADGAVTVRPVARRSRN